MTLSHKACDLCITKQTEEPDHGLGPISSTDEASRVAFGVIARFSHPQGYTNAGRSALRDLREHECRTGLATRRGSAPSSGPGRREIAGAYGADRKTRSGNLRVTLELA